MRCCHGRHEWWRTGMVELNRGLDATVAHSAEGVSIGVDDLSDGGHCEAQRVANLLHGGIVQVLARDKDAVLDDLRGVCAATVGGCAGVLGTSVVIHGHPPASTAGGGDGVVDALQADFGVRHDGVHDLSDGFEQRSRRHSHVDVDSRREHFDFQVDGLSDCGAGQLRRQRQRGWRRRRRGRRRQRRHVGRVGRPRGRRGWRVGQRRRMQRRQRN